MPEKKLKCFVIMPFSQSSNGHTEQYWTSHFHNFLKPEIEKIPALETYSKKEQEIKNVYYCDKQFFCKNGLIIKEILSFKERGL